MSNNGCTNRCRVAWLMAYVVAMGALAGLLLHLRTRTLADMSDAQSAADWQAWRAEAASQAGTNGPVQRKVPRSDEPPTLVLLRDHFAVVMSAGMIFGTVFFGFAMLVTRGLWNERRRPPTNGDASCRGEQSIG